MLVPFAASLSLLVFSLAHSAGALNNVTSLLGTWSSKSNTVFTGPVSHYSYGPTFGRLVLDGLWAL